MPVVTMPKLSDTMVEGTLVKWRKSKGDEIEVGDILAEIETDKATMEMEAFDDGKLTELFASEGDVIKVGDKIAMILGDGRAAGGAQAETPPPERKRKPMRTPASPWIIRSRLRPPRPTDQQPQPGPRQGFPARPQNRRRTRRGSFRRCRHRPGGRIVKRDVEKAPAGGGGSAVSATPAIRAARGIAGEEKSISLSGMRKTIAERLLASKTQIPHFYLSVAMDGGPLMALRRELNAMAEKDGGQKLTVNDFILLAAARAAAQVPRINAAYDGVPSLNTAM